MSDGAILKPDKDFSKDADKVIPEAEALAKEDLQKAIDKLLGLEKQARQVRSPLQWLLVIANIFASPQISQPLPDH